MKRKERRHLKENELVHLFETLRDIWETRQREIGMAAVAVVVIAAVTVGVIVIRQRNQAQGTALLAEARVILNAQVTPAGATTGEDGLPLFATVEGYATEAAKLSAALPKLEAAADTYPDSRAGIEARYYLGGALASLGRYDEAVAAFDEVVARAGEDSLYGRMARLGKAGTLNDAGRLDEAVAAWTELSALEDAYPPDAVLMGLARAYAAQGDTEQARQTLNKIVDQYPDSPYTLEAQEELEAL